MWKPRADRKKIYFLIAAAALLLVGFLYRSLPSLGGLMSLDKEIKLKERQVIKYRNLIANSSNLNERLNFLNNTLKGLETGLLTGKTPALAAADIQMILDEIVTKSNLKVTSIRVLKTEELEQKDYVSVQVEFRIIADIRQLNEILYRLAASPKYLKVIQMTAMVRGKPGEIDCNMTIAGLMKKEKTEKAG
jgi:hypothetical protein